MPLSDPGPRSPVHARRIECEGFRRDDGLWDIEGRIVDRRAFAHASLWDRSNLPAATAVHDMSLRLTVDADCRIVAVEASMDRTPCPPTCTQAAPSYQRLIGLRIAPGFRLEVRALLGGTAGCTHVARLLDNLATVAFQTMESYKLRAVPGIEAMSRSEVSAYFSDDTQPDRRLRPQVNGCVTHDQASPAMRELWPALYRPANPAGAPPASNPNRDREISMTPLAEASAPQVPQGHEWGGHGPRILGIGGTLRAGSSSETAVRIALAAAARLGATTQQFSGRELLLPLYEPGCAKYPPEALRLLAAIQNCDGLIIASPGYHGSVSGVIKNVLDYVEELRGDRRPYFDGRAVGAIVCAYGWQATGTTLTAMRSIVHALRGWPTPLGVAINSATTSFGDNGACSDAAVVAQLESLAAQVMQFARRTPAVAA